MASTAYPMTPSISMLHDRMDTTERRRKRPPNTGSQLLDNQENYLLFSLLGPDNVSLYAAVVELLSAENRQWVKNARGIVSLVKDYQTRAYFLRLYDLVGGQELIWQFRLYKNFQSSMSPKCVQLLTFEGEDGQVFGLNFSSQDEARSFKGHLDKRYEQERKTMAARETRAPVSASSVFSAAPAAPVSYSNGVTPLGTIAPHVEKTPVTSGSSFFNRKKKKDKKPRIRKEDISNPTNFQHKAHVGWDQDSGFSNNVDSEPMDESIKEIVRAAGQDPNNLSKKTIKFVYDFIERYEDSSVAGPAPAQFSRQQAPPPPVPLSQPISQWNTPPAPPSRGASYQSSAPPSRPPPPPPSAGKFNSRPLPQVPSIPDNVRPAAMPPPPPPPMASVAPMGGSIPPPPPPPPPMSSTAPAPPPPPPSFSNSSAPAPPSVRSAMPAPQSGRGDLMAQIQAGKQLRSVAKAEETKSTGGADSRDDVMAQIRLGANLKHVDQAAEQEKRKSGPALADMGGIAGALAKALEERRMNMCIDSSDEEDSDEKNEWSD